MGNGEEQFCLRWNDFQESILSTLQDLRAEEDFVDVTLVCDGEQIKAHKLILSACSDFFRRLLKRNPAPNPVIVLWDISIEDMRNILGFMYNGEVEVLQTHLNPFLSVAERLRVRGLCQSGGKNSPEPPPAGGNIGGINRKSRNGSVSPGPSSSSSSQLKTSSSGMTKRRNSVSPASQARRRSSVDQNDVTGPAHKKSKNNETANDSPSSIDPAIKQESLLLHHNNDEDDENSQQQKGSSNNDHSMRRSSNADNDDSDSEYPLEYYGNDNYDEQTLPSALMGMGRGLLDPATAKELWRRAAMAQMSFGSSNSGSSPPGGGPNPFRTSLDGSSPTEPARRQRSVYSSDQITQLEAYFQVNEYIDGERKRQLSRLTNIPEQQIKVWFQNRRQKKKREQEEQTHMQQI